MEEKKDQILDKTKLVPPKYYADVCGSMPPDYTDYSADIPYGKIEDYEITRKLGSGRYSDVYEGTWVEKKVPVAIKIFRPIKKEKIKREIKIMRLLADCPNVPNFIDLVKEPVTRTQSMIMEYVECKDTDFKLLYKKMTTQDLKKYMHEALKILDFAHSKGIMHRDVKPQNLLYDLTAGSMKLIDWGLAEFYHFGKEYNTNVAAKFYKAPELLLGNEYYDYAVDIWSLGCIFAAVIFQQEIFFQGKDNIDQLAMIVKVIGTDELYDYINGCKLKKNVAILKQIGKHPKKSWIKLKTVCNEIFATDEAIDLVSKMLLVDPSKRIPAKDALAHSYFNNLN